MDPPFSSLLEREVSSFFVLAFGSLVCRILLSETTILQYLSIWRNFVSVRHPEVGCIFQKQPHESVCAQEMRKNGILLLVTK
jgi:hypothetical protein